MARKSRHFLPTVASLCVILLLTVFITFRSTRSPYKDNRSPSVVGANLALSKELLNEVLTQAQYVGSRRLFGEIATAQLQANDWPAAIKSFIQAGIQVEEFVQFENGRLTDSDRFYAAAAAAQSLASTGDIDLLMRSFNFLERRLPAAALDVAGQIACRPVRAYGCLVIARYCGRREKQIMRRSVELGMEAAEDADSFQIKVSLARIVAAHGDQAEISSTLGRLPSVEAAVVAIESRDGRVVQSALTKAQYTIDQLDSAERVAPMSSIVIALAHGGRLNECDAWFRRMLRLAPINNDFPPFSDALYAVADALLAKREIERSLKLIELTNDKSSIRDILRAKIALASLKIRGLSASLTFAASVCEESRRAMCLLEIALELAKSGRKADALKVAKQVNLCAKRANIQFEFQKPRTWSYPYSPYAFVTMSQHEEAIKLATGVALAAVNLSAAIGESPIVEVGVFEDCDPYVTRELARSLVFHGFVTCKADLISAFGIVASSDDCSMSRRYIGTLVGGAMGRANASN